jgi:peptidoglycan-associated lipoprotein
MTMTHMMISLFRNVGFVLVGFIAMTVAGCGPTYPKCDNDDDCHKAEYCVNGLCQQCRNDQDCGKGQQCAAGRCEAIKGYCTTSSDCGLNEECKDNRCVSKPAPAVVEAPPAEAPAGPCTLQSVYFDFDSSDFRSDAKDVISRDVACAREQQATKLHITGYTDPRGTEEYNMALGDRRAQAVGKYVGSLYTGATVSHSSVGEEMAKGSDESGWSTDRRAEFKKQ